MRPVPVFARFWRMASSGRCPQGIDLDNRLVEPSIRSFHGRRSRAQPGGNIEGTSGPAGEGFVPGFPLRAVERDLRGDFIEDAHHVCQ